MSWKLSTDGSGRAVWSGEDSVVDPFYDKRRILWWVYTIIYMMLCWALGPRLLLLPLQLYFEAKGLQGPALMIAMCMPWFGMLLLTYHLTWKWYRRLVPLVNRFYARKWTLTAKDGALTFDAEPFDGPLPAAEIDARHGASWSVPLDAIGRVEVGPTADWQLTRRYDGASSHTEDFALVPKHEFQTFLHMNDGSRRVIRTANADREGSATLAHSIRAWIEGQRHVSSPRAALGEGFNL